MPGSFFEGWPVKRPQTARLAAYGMAADSMVCCVRVQSSVHIYGKCAEVCCFAAAAAVVLQT